MIVLIPIPLAAITYQSINLTQQLEVKDMTTDRSSDLDKDTVPAPRRTRLWEQA